MTSLSTRLRIIVLGYIVRGPLGGMAWHYLQYAAGLSQLGHDVFFFEDSDDYPSCYDPVRNVMDRDPTYGLEFTARAFERLGLGGRWTYYDAHQNSWLGPVGNRAIQLCETADVVLNVSCVNPLRSWMERIPVRALVDTDPVFTQIRHLSDPVARARAADHTAFFSFGNIGAAGCAIPADGFPWRPTRQPIVMDAWKPSRGPAGGPLSTVMVWDSYKSVEYKGTRYGMKSDSFGPYVEVPDRSGETFDLAVGVPSDTCEQLIRHGWTILDPRVPTADPWTYQDFIRRSKAEFSIAKHGYVISQSGWFSERSAAYLASGRPVVVQDTGFPRWLRADEGVLPFHDANSVLEQLRALNAAYDRHCVQARTVAGDYFGSAAVLRDLLDVAFNSSPIEIDSGRAQ
jgi:hypothetical protein